MKFALCGFRHEHAGNLVSQIRQLPGAELVAVCEEQPDACRPIIEKCGVQVTHQSLDQMLADTEFDVLALSDLFVKRGGQAIKGLKAGRHIWSDKPLCTSLEELDEIRSLTKIHGRSVSLLLQLRQKDGWGNARRIIQEGRIGEIVTATVFGQHQLKRHSGRPAWYFEEGQQGGTINDLFVHGLDGLEWVTGCRFSEVVAARAWNHQVKDAPHFQDAAQAMLKLDNGAGVLMDASYTLPEGHKRPWTALVSGTEGELLFDSVGTLTLRRHRETEQLLELRPGTRHDVLADLCNEINGTPSSEGITTADCLRASYLALKIQHAADQNLTFTRL